MISWLSSTSLHSFCPIGKFTTTTSCLRISGFIYACISKWGPMRSYGTSKKGAIPQDKSFPSHQPDFIRYNPYLQPHMEGQKVTLMERANSKWNGKFTTKYSKCLRKCMTNLYPMRRPFTHAKKAESTASKCKNILRPVKRHRCIAWYGWHPNKIMNIKLCALREGLMEEKKMNKCPTMLVCS